jgi:hypothetical protein
VLLHLFLKKVFLDQNSEETETSITLTDAEDDEAPTNSVISKSHEETTDESNDLEVDTLSNDFINSSQSNTTIGSQMTAILKEDIDLSNGNGSVDSQTANFMVHTAGTLTTSAPNL